MWYILKKKLKIPLKRIRDMHFYNKNAYEICLRAKKNYINLKLNPIHKVLLIKQSNLDNNPKKRR